jgi:FemAB-related protein (PEP-CTERM system-associated)
MATDSQIAQPGPAVEVSGDAPDWAPYLAGKPEATVYHDARWGRVMREVYGNEALYLTARRGGQVCGVLQLVCQRSRLWGTHLCSLPYFDASGILADDEQARSALIAEAGRLSQARGAQWVELRQMAPLDDSLPARRDKVTMMLSLPGGGEAMWKQLKTKVRTKVRKAEKHGHEVVRGGGELLGDFCSVYERTIRDLGSPSHNRRFFRRILEAFGETAMVFSVRSQGRPLAASLALACAGRFHVPWSGSDVRFRRLGANRVLYWSMLQYAAEAHLGAFDFGRSTVDSGTYGFKQEWGAEPVPLYWHFVMSEGKSMPDQRPDSPKYRFLVACWKKLPLCVARAVGPRIIRKLS